MLGMALVALLLCAGGVTARAQPRDLFVPVPSNQLAAVTSEQSQLITQLRQQSTTKSLELVRIDPAALQGDSARLTMPDQKALVLSKQSIQSTGGVNFIWHGTLPNVPGSATLVVHDGKITGSVRDGTDLYSIEPVGNGVHAVIGIDQSRFPPEHPPSFQNKERENRGDMQLRGPSATQHDGPVGIDVLVAYTPSAASSVGDIIGTIQLAVAEANQSYVNSGVNIQLSLVDNFQFAETESGKSFDQILADFAGDAGVHQHRDNSGADLSALIINQTDFCGLADAILAKPETAYVVVHYSCATGYYSFAHELGHLMGARHDEKHDSSTSPYSYGHGYEHPSPSPPFCTIMAYACDAPNNCEPRIQYLV